MNDSSPPASANFHRRSWQGPSWIKRLLITVCVILACWVLLVLSVQRRVLFPHGVTTPLPNAGTAFGDLEKIWIDTPPGPVESWLLPGDGVGPESPGPAVIFAHGNGELIDYWPEALGRYQRMGLSVLLAEYRGYGRSAGSPSQTAIAEDFLEFHARLVERPEVDATRLVYHGRSLGGGAVCDLARRKPPTAMILESSFTSISDVAWRTGVPPFLVLDKFNNRTVVTNLDVPVLLLHGRHDQIIPVTHAHRLHDAARQSQLILFDVGHNDRLFQFRAYWQHIEDFLRQAGILGA